MNSNETEQSSNPIDSITATITQALHQASQQAEQTINEAKQQADTIIEDAKQEAERIISDAHEQAESITDSAQADARAKGDMERASLAIQEHAAALHTIALGLTGHDTTPRDNTGNASGSAGANEADESNTNVNDASTTPPAPTATTTYTASATTPANTSRANTPTTRRADGTTRKLAPWEQPAEPQEEPKNTPAPVTGGTPTTNNTEHAATTGDATAPQWDAPLIIDAPLQL